MKRANLETIRLPLKSYFIALLIAILPSRLKVGIYRLAGAKIGKRVKIGFCTIVLAEKFSKISIGDYTDIRSFCLIICKEVNIGKYAQIAVFVWVWGSGKLIMKNKCILSARLRIDLRRNSLYMGEFTGFATGCIIYTHTHFWPYTQGAVNILKDVVLGDYVFVGLNSVVLPGVNIGDYSVVGAGSVVSRSIPPHSFAAGCPAKVISSTDKFLDKVNSEELKRRILEIAEDMVDYFGYNTISKKDEKNISLIRIERKKHLRRKIWTIVVGDGPAIVKNEVFSSLKRKNTIIFSTSKVPDEISSKIPIWFDLKNSRCCDLSSKFSRDIWIFLHNTWCEICDDFQ